MRRILTPERPDWRDTAARLGFRFHTIDGASGRPTEGPPLKEE